MAMIVRRGRGDGVFRLFLGSDNVYYQYHAYITPSRQTSPTASKGFYTLLLRADRKAAQMRREQKDTDERASMAFFRRSFGLQLQEA